MWQAFRSAYGLNALAVRFDGLLTRMESYAAMKGKQYTLVALAPKLFSNTRVLGLLARLDRKTPAEPSAERALASENSVLLYYSPAGSYYFPKQRFVAELVTPTMLGLFSYSWIFVGAQLAFMTVYQPMVYSLARHFVVRMELLPSQEAILFHKVGIFGLPRTELVPIKNLQKLDPLNSKFKVYFSRSSVCDPDLLFRDSRTTCEYGFDRNGVWMEENLKHDLIA